jgi:hypothetical protein
VEAIVLRLFKLLKHIQEINLSPKDTLAVLWRLETENCRAEDDEVLIKVLRVHTEFVEDGGPPRPRR